MCDSVGRHLVIRLSGLLYTHRETLLTSQKDQTGDSSTNVWSEPTDIQDSQSKHNERLRNAIDELPNQAPGKCRSNPNPATGQKTSRTLNSYPQSAPHFALYQMAHLVFV